MANTITFDFRHYYQKGERRESEQIAYQWDLGHVAEIFVPVNATYEMHYCFSDYTETDDYAVESISAADDGGYKLIAHIPNIFFERSGELRVYIIGSADDHILTTYEGYITIRERIKPEDYVDDDPDNGAESIIERAREYADDSEAWAVGQVEGVDVPSTAPQYQNNSKYYAQQAEDSATAAQGSATAAASSEENSEAWAVGTKDGTAVTSDDPQYHNNSKYWAETIIENFAPVEVSPSENAYAIGDYLLYGNQLYRVTAPIAIDDALTVGTNITATTIGEVLEAFDPSTIQSILGDFATVESSTTASKAYKVGEFLTYNWNLYKVTTAIASGGTITVGTNVVQTTVGEEIQNRTLWWASYSIDSTSGSAGTLATITDARITADHVLTKFVAANPSYITADVTCTTSAGQALITGVSTAATTAEIMLEKKDN